MKYKMICIDMDGTLLNSKKVVSEENRIALKKAYEKGVHIIICTGRNPKNAIYFSEFLGVNCAVIANNGAWVIDEDKEVIISKDVLDENQCMDIMSICKEYKGVPSFHSRDSVYWPSRFRKYLCDIILNKKIPEKYRVKNIYVKEKEEWREVFKSNNTGKCIIIELNTSKLKKIRENLIKKGNYEITQSGRYALEVNNKGVSKGRAVKALAEEYKIKREEIICIGDNENDLSMITYAGLGVAMGNAIDSLKEKADYITESSDKNGVAKVIYEFVLKND
ncbi:HAD family hydrolase [Clostridium perfringens]|uniref:HAD family hydrolase n=1 Tax=Clostridium perfringens TaxID=1502 RepID=UPI001ABB3442|nr:HAD family hydrolase [Clostridium perfringens]MBO3340120.1 HAD family hydrolase [Clostridium perfringens]